MLAYKDQIPDGHPHRKKVEALIKTLEDATKDESRPRPALTPTVTGEKVLKGKTLASLKIKASEKGKIVK